jgi:DNA-dependent protein kinase catalytic subunit
MKRCYHDNRAILKNNLELLKIITECWRHLINIPVEILNNYLKSNDQKKLTAGIQLFGVVLSNNVENYDYPDNFNKIEFYKSLIRCMKDTSKTIHAAAAEVIGMLLNNLSKIEKDLDKDGQNMIDEIVLYLNEQFKDMRIELFITCVHRITLNFPEISNNFMAKLLFNLPKLFGEFKIMCAESILASIKQVTDPIFKLQTFTEMIEHRDSSLQLVCLKMIYALIDKQNPDELARLLKMVCNFINHPNVACRYQMLEILRLVDEIYHNVDNHLTSVIKKLTYGTMLKLLLDEDQVIRLMAQNFWIEKVNLPENTIDRMVMILEKLYSPETEGYIYFRLNILYLYNFYMK